MNICKRLTREGKVHALIILSEVIAKVNNPMINNDIIYVSIIQFYGKCCTKPHKWKRTCHSRIQVLFLAGSRDDCEGALAFIQKIRENDVFISKTVLNELQQLLDRCHCSVNDDLIMRHV